MVYLENVTYQYGAKEKLIEDLCLNIQQGHIYGLLGPSGCGKSTTLKIILGLLRPHRGKVMVFGSTPYTPDCPVPGKAEGIGNAPS